MLPVTLPRPSLLFYSAKLRIATHIKMKYRQVLLQSCLQISVLVVEQTNACKRHHHIVFIAACDHICITHGSTGLCDVFYAALMCSLDVIGEGEERIASQSHILHFVKPCSLFLSGKYGRFYLEDAFPCAVCQHIHVLITHVDINGIVTVGSA